jgi:hypothetical protein
MTMNSPAAEEALAKRATGDEVGADCGVIEMHLHTLNQLFDSLDPSPFREKDLDHNAEQYVVESLKELPSHKPCALVIFLDQASGQPDEAPAVGDAIRAHFARRSQFLRRDLHKLLRRGWISLAIGLVFLAVVFTIAHSLGRPAEENSWVKVLREGLIIVGWVAMWRPLEIFLYDWYRRAGLCLSALSRNERRQRLCGQ